MGGHGIYLPSVILLVGALLISSKTLAVLLRKKTDGMEHWTLEIRLVIIKVTVENKVHCKMQDS